MDHNDGHDPPRRAYVGATVAPRDDNLDVEIDNLTRIVVQQLYEAQERNGGGLSPREIKTLRSIIRREENVKWAWGVARLWGFWIASTVAFFILVLDYLKALLKRLVQ